MLVLHEPPVYCVHAIVHNEDVVARFEALGVVFVDAAGRRPFGRPMLLSAHGSAPAAVAAAHAAHRRGRRRRLPARRQGAPRAAGPGRRRATRSSTSATPATTKRSAPWPRRLGDGAGRRRRCRGRPGVAAVARWPCWPRRPCRRPVGRRRDGRPRPLRVGVGPATRRHLLRHHQPPGRRARPRRRAATPSSWWARPSSANTAALVTTARTPVAARGSCAWPGPPTCPADLDGVVGVAAGASTPPGAVAAVLRGPLGPATIEAVSVVDELEYFPLAPPLRRAVGAIVARRRLPRIWPGPSSTTAPCSAEQLLGLVATHRPGQRAQLPVPDRLGLCLVVTLPLELVIGARVWRRPKRLAKALLPPLALFLVWDFWAAAQGQWRFNQSLTTDLRLPVRCPDRRGAVLRGRADLRPAHAGSGPVRSRRRGWMPPLYPLLSVVAAVAVVLLECCGCGPGCSATAPTGSRWPSSWRS